MFHAPLELSGCGAQAKGNAYPLVEPPGCDEGSQGAAFFIQETLVVRLALVQHRKPRAPTQRIQHLLNSWYWVAVRNLFAVELSEVTTKAKNAIFLADTHHGR